MIERISKRIHSVRETLKDGSIYYGNGVVGPSEADRNWANSFHGDEGGGAKMAAAIAIGTVGIVAFSSNTIMDAMSNRGPAPIVRSASGPSAAPTETVTPIPSPSARINMAPTPTPNTGACPDVETALQIQRTVNGVGMTGIPDSVSVNVVDRAVVKDHPELGGNPAFTNTVGQGSEIALAKPGVYIGGADLVDRQANNPYGANPGGADTIYGSGGSIHLTDAEYRAVFRACPPEFQNLPEGGWDFYRGQEGIYELGHYDQNGKWTSDGVKFQLNEVQGRNYFFITRGVYPNGQQNTDGNKTWRVSSYIPGHNEVDMMPSRDETNAAFVDETRVLQDAQTSHSRANCGANGCSELVLVIYDANTKAVVILDQNQGRNQDASQGWIQTYTNITR